MSLQQIEQAFQVLDESLDATLDEEQTVPMQGAIAAALSIRLVQYVLGSHLPPGAAEKIAIGLTGQLAQLKRDIVREQWQG
jgi:hypothetical protein